MHAGHVDPRMRRADGTREPPSAYLARGALILAALVAAYALSYGGLRALGLISRERFVDDVAFLVRIHLAATTGGGGVLDGLVAGAYRPATAFEMWCADPPPEVLVLRPEPEPSLWSKPSGVRHSVPRAKPAGDGARQLPAPDPSAKPAVGPVPGS